MSWGIDAETFRSYAERAKSECPVSVALADTAAKIVTFYLHERLWLRINFGRQPPPDYEI